MRIGREAGIIVLSKYIRPFEHIRSKWPNPESGHRLRGVVIRQEMKEIRGKDQLSIIFHCEDFKDSDGNPIELYAVKRWCHIIKEGPSDFFYDTEPTVEAAGTQSEQELILEEAAQVMDGGDGQLDEMESGAIRGVAETDDDNEPAPENIPTANGQQLNPRKRKPDHQLLALPTYKKFQGSKIVDAQSQYPQKLCQCRSHRVRTYCQCSPGTHYCDQCYAEHVAEDRLVPSTGREEKAAENRRISPWKRKPDHQLLALPTYKKFQGSKIVDAQSQYPQKLCQCRSHRVRTYCQCSPGTHYCNQCYAEHVAENHSVPTNVSLGNSAD
ncbi:hypothetical protein IV203_030877 [Nitzschia inconspicua]|uniref:Uncharacterized protein n=1 Tax=Nitzschia inconspicua TaxID=303405 RepID=A0A9K3LT66_9STRA|nr:hypothetical protein IV203_030877 [Nitzschia inconspicua]